MDRLTISQMWLVTFNGSKKVRYQLLTIIDQEHSFASCKAAVDKKIKEGCAKLPLHQPLRELKNKTFYQHFREHEKYKNWTLADFIRMGAINCSEQDEQGYSLMQRLIIDNDLRNIKVLLIAMPSFNLADYSLGSAAIKSFLDYRPGKGEMTIKEFAAQRNPNKLKLQALIFDQEETTDASSSAAEMSSDEYLSEVDLTSYTTTQSTRIAQFNEPNHRIKDHLGIRLLAARGVHYLPKYFPTRASRQRIANTRHVPHTTYSASTLFDSGYEADSEPDEKDARIVARHHKNLKFIADLQATPDKKEKKIGKIIPPKSRNEVQFKNLFWRYIQVYINSYSYLFNSQAIKINFGFDTNNNPEISMSWDIEKAMMYASGCRFDWEGPARKRDPHYRRFNGKPKHPTMGYVDIFSFDPYYVRTHGVDRWLAYKDGDIKLSNLFLYEAEIIFHSQVNKEYHVKRRIISLPSFAGEFSPKRDQKLGISCKSTHTKTKNKLLNLPLGRDKKSELVGQITQNAVAHQSRLLKSTLQVSLFRLDQVHAFNHGDTLQSALPGPNYKR